MELGFATLRSGRIPNDQVQRAAELGAFIRGCYGDSNRLAATAANGTAPIVLDLPGGATAFDRIMLQEDIAQGQRVRRYSVEYRAGAGEPWLVFSNGTSVGHKRIDLTPANISLRTGAALRVVFTSVVASPIISNFAAFGPCARS